ncbi:MAG: hypothetical protein SGBAC_000212 [Bacillariaceae sp.]
MSEGSNHELRVPPKLRIPRPEFTIDSENDDLELWSFRLPTNVPLSKLNGMAIDLKNNVGKFKVGDVEYKIILGDSVENEAFRVLVPASESSEEADDDESMEDSDDEEGPQKYLQVSSLPFTKHWNVVSAFPQRTERELAPREGPTPVDKIRHAYCHVPQRTGLKRRWMPMGVKADKSLASINPMLSTSRTPSKSTNSKSSSSIEKGKGKGTPISPEGTDMDTSTPSSKRIKVEHATIKSEKKANKAERKSAKKAKKEAKKLKKDKRKSK